MRPVVDRLETEYGDRVAFVALDAAHEGRDAFEAGGLPGHPSYVLVQPDGTEVWRGFGVLKLAALEAAVQDAVE